ncbi:MAG: hypothetical protein LBT85_02735 [Bifidobacteriaceae bacterium]|jgi:hypothetical protein|nr:hypothetical protein [Bifidobacteriaceae bacterium]
MNFFKTNLNSNLLSFIKSKVNKSKIRNSGILVVTILLSLTCFLSGSNLAGANASISVIPVSRGGTGANTQAGALTNLGINNTIDENSSNSTFPSAKTVYDYMNNYSKKEIVKPITAIVNPIQGSKSLTMYRVNNGVVDRNQPINNNFLVTNSLYDSGGGYCIEDECFAITLTMYGIRAELTFNICKGQSCLNDDIVDWAAIGTDLSNISSVNEMDCTLGLDGDIFKYAYDNLFLCKYNFKRTFGSASEMVSGIYEINVRTNNISNFDEWHNM